MKRLLSTGILTIALVAGSALASAAAVAIGEEGCTPGYWKNHPATWEESPGTPLPFPGTVSGYVGWQQEDDGTVLEGMTVRDALDRGDRDQMLALAERPDADTNLGCPL